MVAKKRGHFVSRFVTAEFLIRSVPNLAQQPLVNSGLL